MKKFISLLAIALFTITSFADDYIREPLSVLEAAITSGGDELVGKNENCF